MQNTIKKIIELKAPLDRVWQAVGDAKQFGTWFGVEFDGNFKAGTKLTGKIRPTKVNAEVAKLQEPHAGKTFEFVVDQIEPKQQFSFRWHPFAIDPNIDYSQEPTTLVVFHLEATADGTRLTIAESGFDQIPAYRKEQAFTANDSGWSKQTSLINKFLTMQPAG